MTFTVTYREKSGAKAEAEILAASRAECVAECRKRGITPMGIQEGKRGKDAPRSRADESSDVPVKRTMRISAKWVGMAVGVVVLGIVFWMFLSQDKTGKPSSNKPSPRTISKERPPTEKVAPAPTNTVEKVHGKEIKPRKRREPVVHREPEITKNAPPPKIDALDLIKNSTVISNTVRSSRVLFKSRSENLLAGIISSKPGYRVINLPLDAGFVEDFKSSLGNPITIDDEDTPADIELKQAVVDAKAMLLEEMGKGGDITRIISDAREDLNRLADYRKSVQMTYSSLVREGRPPEECEVFRKEANELLKEYGLPPIDEPGRKPKGRRSLRRGTEK